MFQIRTSLVQFDFRSLVRWVILALFARMNFRMEIYFVMWKMRGKYNLPLKFPGFSRISNIVLETNQKRFRNLPRMCRILGRRVSLNEWIFARKSLKQLCRAQRQCIRRSGNESLTRVTQKTALTAKKKLLKGKRTTDASFHSGKTGPSYTNASACGCWKRSEEHEKLQTNERNIYIFTSYMTICISGMN